MMKISTAVLRELEVINLCGGAKLGYPCDFEIDAESAKILSIIVCSGGGLPFITKKEEYLIPWQMIQCIGEDAILVKLNESDLISCCVSNKKGKKKI